MRAFWAGESRRRRNRQRSSAHAIASRTVTLAEGRGICFDYAALMSAMLRVQQIPTRLITGYVDEGYHAWVEVYVQNEGWINPEILFESRQWTRMDPTYASVGMNYKGQYQDKYRY